jgi:hypothetical protein
LSSIAHLLEQIDRSLQALDIASDRRNVSDGCLVDDEEPGSEHRAHRRVDSARNANIGANRVFPPDLTPPRDERWGVRFHPPADNRHEPAARGESLESLFDVLRPDRGVAPGYSVAGAGERRVHHDHGRRDVVGERRVEVLRVDPRHSLEAQARETCHPILVDLVGPDPRPGILREHGKVAVPGARLQNHVPGLDAGRPVSEVGIGPRRRELLQTLLLCRSPGLGWKLAVLPLQTADEVLRQIWRSVNRVGVGILLDVAVEAEFGGVVELLDRVRVLGERATERLVP